MAENRVENPLSFFFFLNRHHMFSCDRKNRSLITFTWTCKMVCVWFSQPLPYTQAKRKKQILILESRTRRSSNPSYYVCVHYISGAFIWPSALTFDALKSKGCTLRCSSKTKTHQPKSLSGPCH